MQFFFVLNPHATRMSKQPFNFTTYTRDIIFLGSHSKWRSISCKHWADICVCTYMYILAINCLWSWPVRERNMIRHLVLFVFVWVQCFVPSLICVASHFYMCMHSLYVCLGAYCKYMPSLVAAWVWGHLLQQLPLFWVNQCIQNFVFLQKNPKLTKPKGFTKYVNSSVRTDFFKRLSTVEVYLRRAN